MKTSQSESVSQRRTVRLFKTLGAGGMPRLEFAEETEQTSRSPEVSTSARLPSARVFKSFS